MDERYDRSFLGWLYAPNGCEPKYHKRWCGIRRVCRATRIDWYGCLRQVNYGAGRLSPIDGHYPYLTSAVGSTWIPTALRLVLHLTQAVHLPKGELIIQAEVSLSTIVLEPSSTTDAQTSPLANRTPCTARPKRSNRTPCAY